VCGRGTALAPVAAMTTPRRSLALPVQSGRDHIRGILSAPITLLEYGDFECPHCGAAWPVVEEVRRRMGEQLRFVYRHFPLVAIHPHAEHAAEAAEAAGTQGQFWPMHDLLFAHQDALADADLLAYAAELFLNTSRFARDLASSRYASRVQEDLVSGMRSGVQGTPTFFINGERHAGGYDLESLLGAVERVAPIYPRAG
jgi:protein-disulfide isomerase